METAPRNPPRRRHWLRPAIIAATLALAAGLAGWYWLAAPKPPAAKLDGADPAVVAAIEQAERSVRRLPRSASRWGRLGSVYYAHDFYAEADYCLAQAERFDPDSPRWPYLRGRSMQDQDPDKALPMLQRAAELCANDPDAPAAPRLKYAEILLERGRLDEAEALLKAVLARDGDDPRALLGMGRLELTRGNADEAVDWLTRSVGQRGDVKAAHTLLATAYQRLGRQAEAADELRVAATLPENVLWNDPYLGVALGLRVGRDADIERAGDLLRQGRKPEAVALLERVTARYPDSARAWWKLGAAYIESGKPADAERALRTAVRVAPDMVEAHNELGRAMFEQGDYAEAERHFRAALDRNPNLAETWFNLGQCRARSLDWDGAAEAFAQTVRLKPDLAVAHIDLGVALLRDGRAGEAVGPLERAVQLKQDDPRAQHLLAEARREAGEPITP